MQCRYCNVEVDASTKFCPQCGKQLSEPDSSINHTQISKGWIEDAIRQLGYMTDNERCEPNEFRATKEKRVTLYVALKKDLKIITFISYLPLKKLGRSDRTELLECLNLSNGKGTYCTFYANLDKEFLMIYSFLPITETLSKQDVMYVVEKFSDEMAITATSTRLIDYLT